MPHSSELYQAYYHQKGLDLLLSNMPEILNSTKDNFIILGSGEKEQEDGFVKLSESYPNRIGLKIGFDDTLARRIFAGSDFFVMPSRFEPLWTGSAICNEIRFIPIARKTGGLSDTIISRTEKQKHSNGYLFKKLIKNH